MKNISFDLVSPEKLLFSEEVGIIIVPAKDGDIGVLPGHSKVLSSLRPGRVLVFGEDKMLLKAYFLTGGFVEINPEKCIILAEEVEEMSSLDKQSIEKEINELEAKDNQESKSLLIIAKSKIESLNANYYDKI